MQETPANQTHFFSYPLAYVGAGTAYFQALGLLGVCDMLTLDEEPGNVFKGHIGNLSSE